MSSPKTSGGGGTRTTAGPSSSTTSSEEEAGGGGTAADGEHAICTQALAAVEHAQSPAASDLTESNLLLVSSQQTYNPSIKDKSCGADPGNNKFHQTQPGQNQLTPPTSPFYEVDDSSPHSVEQRTTTTTPSPLDLHRNNYSTFQDHDDPGTDGDIEDEGASSIYPISPRRRSRGGNRQTRRQYEQEDHHHHLPQAMRHHYLLTLGVWFVVLPLLLTALYICLDLLRKSSNWF
ncbi:hypothetical protein QBC38DRAFT_442066 [Podospora fimiseda]|uniref:Uncharacterized protein n=1 Tax=Podospora fimiseda TaxID=252190 RepID=A0AAN7BTS4_9PEZI|nr:hypothetical protein QBC38DRAFT_442066 [Podospora fimiseda]